MVRTVNNNRIQRRRHSNSVHRSVKLPASRRHDSSRRLPSGIKLLPYYGVPEEVKNCLLPRYTFRKKIENLQRIYPSLFHTPTFRNYIARMRALIYIEEVQETYEMEAYNMNRVFLKRILECDCYFLEIENLVDRRPSLTIGGMVLASDRKFTKKGAIVDVEDNGVLLKFPPSFSQEYRNQIFSMRFLCSRFNFRKQHYSVEEAHRRLGTNVLFPTMPVMNETIQCDAQLNRDLKICVSLENGEQVLVDWFNSRLDEFQKIAIKNILRGECRPMPYVIFGPPGAGKTFTIVEAALQIVKCVTDCRILIGTTSNSAADLLSELLIDSGFLSSSDFVRVISHNYLERDLIPDRIKPYCATISLGSEADAQDPMFVTNTGMKLHCQIQHLKPFKIIISTCSTLGNFHQLNFDAGHFTHVLIDEAGQCTEPECLIPISMVNKDIGQIILVGDPMQLGPNVHCKIAMSRGLEDSYLVRLLKQEPYQKFEHTGFDPRLVTKLLYNYRSIPSILKPYNELFYSSELRAANQGGNDLATFLKVREMFHFKSQRNYHGVYFFNVMGRNQQDLDSPSWYNSAEAKCIFVIAKKMMNNGISAGKIGVITPYYKQVLEIRNLFGSTPDCPRVGTVEEFQGQEFDIILISTVRTFSQDTNNSNLGQSMGFVRCPRRMNVAISRARAFLMVFGDADLLSMNKEWEKFITMCSESDAYVNMNQSFDFYNFLA